jgi:hypothetical protein
MGRIRWKALLVVWLPRAIIYWPLFVVGAGLALAGRQLMVAALWIRGKDLG